MRLFLEDRTDQFRASRYPLAVMIQVQRLAHRLFDLRHRFEFGDRRVERVSDQEAPDLAGRIGLP